MWLPSSFLVASSSQSHATVITIFKIFSSLVFTFKGVLFQYLGSKYGIVLLYNFILTHEKLNAGFELGKVTHGMAFSAFRSFPYFTRKTMILQRHQKLYHSVENLIHRITIIADERNFRKKSSTTHFATFTVV